MKRSHEEEKEEEEPTTSKPRMEEARYCGETTILHDLQSNLLKGDLNSQIEKRLFETQKEYFTVYMEKLMYKIPMGEDLVKIIQSKGSPNEFEYMFTAAKSVIQSQMRVKQIKAFHAVFDMVYSLSWRYVHEKVVSPTLEKVLSSKQLNLAYEEYQNCSNMEEEGSVIEMQCLLYCIQEMLESQEPVKIPNPLYSRFTQQMKAMSEYVITLLVALSKPTLLSEEEDAVVRKQETGGNAQDDRVEWEKHPTTRKGDPTLEKVSSPKNTLEGGPRSESNPIMKMEESPNAKRGQTLESYWDERKETMETNRTIRNEDGSDNESDSEEDDTSESD